MVSVEDIDRIVNGWPQEDFIIESGGRIDDDTLGEYIDLFTRGLISSAPALLAELLTNKHRVEIENAKTDENFAHAAMFFDFVMNCYNYIVGKFYDNSVFHLCAMNLVHHMIGAYQAFLAQCIAGLPLASLPHLRTMYETYVIAKYIMKHKNLARPFKDHSIVVQYRIAAEFDKDGDLGELEIRYNRLIAKYGKVFAEDLGWTYAQIPRKNERRLSTLAKDVGLSEYRSLYVLTSELIHASSYAATRNSLTSKELVAYFQTAAELLTNGLIHLLNAIGASNKVRIILMNILYALREELYDESQGTGRTQ